MGEAVSKPVKQKPFVPPKLNVAPRPAAAAARLPGPSRLQPLRHQRSCCSAVGGEAHHGAWSIDGRGIRALSDHHHRLP